MTPLAGYKYEGPAMIWLILGGVGALFGLLLLIGGAIWPGIVFLALGGAPIAIKLFGTKVYLSCYEPGFILKVKKGNGPEQETRYGWQDVTSTKWYMTVKTTVDDDGTRTTTRRFFMIGLNPGEVTIEEKGKGFKEVITVFNERTPHLPYVWQNTKGRSYAQVARQQQQSL